MYQLKRIICLMILFLLPVPAMAAQCTVQAHIEFVDAASVKISSGKEVVKTTNGNESAQITKSDDEITVIWP